MLRLKFQKPSTKRNGIMVVQGNVPRFVIHDNSHHHGRPGTKPRVPQLTFDSMCLRGDVIGRAIRIAANIAKRPGRWGAGNTKYLCCMVPLFSMAFDYKSPAELFMPKRKGVGGRRSTQVIAGSPPQRRLSASQSRNFPPSGHSALGCRLEMSGSVALLLSEQLQ